MKEIITAFRNPNVSVVTLQGLPGMGKSLIVYHVGHRMLELGYGVCYINVQEKCASIDILTQCLVKISGHSSNTTLEKWARNINSDTLLILDNVDGVHWVREESAKKFQEDFLDTLNELCSSATFGKFQYVQKLPILATPGTAKVGNFQKLPKLATPGTAKVGIFCNWQMAKRSEQVLFI